MDKSTDSFKDGDFQTLRRLLDAGALGEIKEAELHYDFEGAGAWFPTDQDKYTPGSGMTFGLGRLKNTYSSELGPEG